MELIYLRKSQADNPNESVEEVLEKHEYQLQEYAMQELGYTIPEENIYREVVSGETIRDRVEIKKILQLIELEEITAVIVIEPQRLGRGDLEDCGRTVNAFRYTNTKIMTPTKTYDLQDKYDRKFFEMELQRGSDYLEYYKEIQARGRLASVKRGNYIGSTAPYGYKKIQITDENGKKCFTLQEIPEEAAALRKAYDLFVNEAYGFRKIATALDELGFKPRKIAHWSPSAIKDMLSNPVYIGKVRWNWRKGKKVIENGVVHISRPKAKDSDIYEGKHQGIIDEKTYYAALDRMGRNIRARENVKIRNPFAGLLYCKCGRAMTYRTYKTPDGQDRCEPRLLCDDQVHCHSVSCTYQEIEQRVIAILKDTIANFEVELDQFDEKSHRIQTSTLDGLKAKQNAVKKKEVSLWEKYTEDAMPKDVFDSLLRKITTEKAHLERSIQNLEKAKKDKKYFCDHLVTFRNALTALTDPAIPAEKKNAFLKECIERITYTRQKADHKGTCKAKGDNSKAKPVIHLEVTLHL